MLHIAVCDDEEIFLKRITEIIQEYLYESNISHRIDCYHSGKEFIAINERIKDYDVVFMDINMEYMDGIETARVMRAVSPSLFLVFVTSFLNYTLEGYKVEAIRYVLKDYDGMSENIKEALDTVMQKMKINRKSVTYDFVEEKNKKVMLQEIMYVENILHKVSFHIMESGVEKIYTLYQKLDKIEEDFKATETTDFVRTHQSFLVNLAYVLSMKRYSMTIKNGVNIPISKNRYEQTKENFMRRKGAI